MTSWRDGGLARVTGVAAAVLLVGAVIAVAVADREHRSTGTAGPSPGDSAPPSDDPASADPEVTSSPSPGEASLDLMSVELTGWQHHGPGRFVVEQLEGEVVYRTEGGMGLLWYEQPFADFTLSFEVQVEDEVDNSGVFLRIPEPPTDDGYVNAAFEVQIDTDGEGPSGTGAIYSIQGPYAPVPLEPGTWHAFEIVASGPAIDVRVDGELVNAFQARTEGVVERFVPRGRLGLQNHGDEDTVRYRRIRVVPH